MKINDCFMVFEEKRYAVKIIENTYWLMNIDEITLNILQNKLNFKFSNHWI